MTAAHLATDPHAQPAVCVDLPSLVTDVKGLVSPPHIYLRVSELMRSSDSDARDFAEVIQLDPNLTARLLRIANSSFYSFRSKVDTVSRAVAVIGMRDLYSLVIAVSAVQSFSKIPNDLVNMDTFWRHSIYCGLIARALANRCHVLHTERMFVAGLLHDIGSLVIFNRLPDVARDLLLIAQGDETALYHAEKETLGFTHAHVGGVLLDHWQVPRALHRSVAAHHEPLLVLEGRLEASIVHLADVLANDSDLGALYEDSAGETSVAAEDWEAVGLDAGGADKDEILSEAGRQFIETVTMLGIGGA